VSKIYDATIPPSVVMALDLDDSSVIRSFHDQGVDFVTDADNGKVYVGVSDRKAALSFIEELEYRGSSEWDTPFGVRMGMIKVAKRLRREWVELLMSRV
jgi:hypothetical protein